MKRNISRVSAILAMLMMVGVVVSCGGNNNDENGGQQMTKEEKKQEAKKIEQQKTEAAEQGLPNYRYVDVDSVLKGYHLAKDYDEKFLSKQKQLEDTYRQKSKNLENTGASLQKEYEKLAAGSTPLEQQQFEKKMKDYQTAQANAEKDMGKMQENMQKEFMDAQNDLTEKVQKFIEEYNEQRGYDAIFMKAATLYIDPRLDITQEVIDGLNKQYNKKK